MKVGSRLTNHFCHKYKIDPSTVIKIEKIKAKKLIVSNRLDLIAKLKYIEFKEKGFDMGFAKDLYNKTHGAFNFGTCFETKDTNKDVLDKSFKKFDHMIDQIKQNGFDENISIIPVGAKNTILEGSHRTAIAAYFDLEVSIVRFEDIYVNYDAKFFKKRLLDEKYLDYIVTEYCKLKESVFFACVWPRVKEENKIREVENRITSSTNIIYSKSVSLNYQGLRNLMVQVYGSDDWIGTIENRFTGVNKKANACFDSRGGLNCFVLECESFEEILKMKSDIRSILRIEKNSIHITDNQQESIQLCNQLLNRNSTNFLNNGTPFYYKKFYKKINMFRNNLVKNNLSIEDFIVDSSSIMGLYGLREPDEIGVLTVSDDIRFIDDKVINIHNEDINFYQTTIDDLILNPSNYFVYNDLKFISIDNFKKFKNNRNERQDQKDIQLFNNNLNKRNALHPFLLKISNFLAQSLRGY